jgi:hypothetical protein
LEKIISGKMLKEASIIGSTTSITFQLEMVLDHRMAAEEAEVGSEADSGEDLAAEAEQAVE